MPETQVVKVKPNEVTASTADQEKPVTIVLSVKEAADYLDELCDRDFNATEAASNFRSPIEKALDELQDAVIRTASEEDKVVIRMSVKVAREFRDSLALKKNGRYWNCVDDDAPIELFELICDALSKIVGECSCNDRIEHAGGIDQYLCPAWLDGNKCPGSTDDAETDKETAS